MLQIPLGRYIVKINAQRSMEAPSAKIIIPNLGPAPRQEDAGIAPSPDLATRAFPPTKYAPNMAKPINAANTPPKRKAVTNIQIRCGIVISFGFSEPEPAFSGLPTDPTCRNSQWRAFGIS